MKMQVNENDNATSEYILFLGREFWHRKPNDWD